MVRKNCWHTLTILLVLLFGSWGLAQEKPPESTKKKPSLAELARQARAKKAASGQPARTITNADLPSLEAKLSQGSYPEEARDAEAPAEDQEPVEGELLEEGVEEDDPFAVNDAFDESLSGEILDESDFSPEQMMAWEDAFREARLQYQNAVNEALVLQLRVNNLENSYFSQSDGAVQERLAADLDQTLQAISANKQAQEGAKSALETLRSNAAAAGLSSKEIDELVGNLPTAPPEIEIREPEPDPNEPPSS